MKGQGLPGSEGVKEGGRGGLEEEGTKDDLTVAVGAHCCGLLGWREGEGY